MVRLVATQNDEGTRLSRFVLQNTWRLPNGLLYKSFRNKRIKVNGRPGGPNARLATGDVVELYLNDEFFAFPPPDVSTVETPDLLPKQWAVVFQDDRFAVLYKAGGVFSHGAERAGKANLLHSYTLWLAGRGLYDPDVENAFAPALCNRLDYGTEGLVLAAGRMAALREINTLLRAGFIEKHYLAITCGVPPEGVHEAFLLRDRDAKTVRVATDTMETAKPIRTGVHVLEQAGGLALCAITLYTGRTHQIRAHLAALGAPVLGDQKYGGNRAGNRYSAGPLALCAQELVFSASIPPENMFSDLSGRCFSADGYARLPGAWAALAEAYKG